jgi:hypothetical protein
MTVRGFFDCCLLKFPFTTIVVVPGQRCHVGVRGNFIKAKLATEPKFRMPHLECLGDEVIKLFVTVQDSPDAEDQNHKNVKCSFIKKEKL